MAYYRPWTVYTVCTDATCQKPGAEPSIRPSFPSPTKKRPAETFCTVRYKVEGLCTTTNAVYITVVVGRGPVGRRRAGKS